MSSFKKILLIAVGNEIRGDDGAGQLFLKKFLQKFTIPNDADSEQSLIQKSSEKYLEFSILGKAGKKLKVIYNGIIPDAFSSDAPVIIEGTYNISNETFYAKNLMAKCPSKYEVSVEE